jgi:transposase InsO family protein
MSAATSFS